MPLGTRLAPGGGRREWTLRRQLVGLLILFTAGPLLLTNAWGYLQSRRFFAATEVENVRDVAALEATGVLRFVDAKHHLSTSIVAGNQHLFGLLRALASPDPQVRASVTRALAAHLEAKAKENEAIEEFYVLSPAGRLLASSRARSVDGEHAATRLCYRRGRQVAAIDGIDYAGVRPALLLSAPIVDSQSRFLGVLCTRVGFDLRGGLALGNHPGHPLTRLTLIGPAGRVVDAAPLGSEPLGRPLADADSKWHFGSKAWDGRFLTADHRDVIAAYAPIPELGWGVLVQSPVKAAMGALDTLKWQAAFFSVLLTTLVILAVFVMARRISEPLMALADAARRAASGTLGVRVPPGGTVEIADLARSFNQMNAAVKDSRDLLEHRIAERTQALRKSQEFAERLLDSIAQPVVVIDPELRVVKANPAARRRYGEHVVGERYEEGFECEQGADAAPLRAVLETRRATNVERMERVGETEDMVNLQMFPVLSPDGECEAVIQLRRVVTDERRLQAQMINQEKMSAFGIVAAGVAHEIGNPLAAIESQLQLAREAPAPGRVERTLEIVTGEVQRIGRLLRELVSFSRRREEGPLRISVPQVIHDVTRLLEHDPRAKEVDVVVRASDGSAAVSATEDHLVQVFLNLGLNALDAMPDGGTLTFDARLDGEQVVVRVQDTGGGVPEPARPHLFEPFFTTKDPGRGTGLGLFVSKGIVEALEGTLTLETTDATGSVFRIELPVAPAWTPRQAL